MAILGLNDTVTVKTKTQTATARGGVSTVLTDKIVDLVCSIQPARREEIRWDLDGMNVIEPYVMSFDIIDGDDQVVKGDVVVHNSINFLVVATGVISGKGTHNEAVLKKISSDSFSR